MQIEKSEPVKKWMRSLKSKRSGSRHTERIYLKSLKQFCEWSGRTPEQVLAEPDWVKDKLEEFFEELTEKRGYSRMTAKLYYTAIVSFFKYNHQKIHVEFPKVVSRGGVRAHTIEEIKTLLDVCGPRDRFVLLGLKDTGMSREDFVTLTYGHVKAGLEKRSNFIPIEVIRQKEQLKYHTVLGPNAVKALKTWLEIRRREGEKITDETPLVKSAATIEPTALTPEGLSVLLERIGDRAGFKTSPHRFRKFFVSNLGSKISGMLLKYMTGHALGVERAYFQPEVKNILTAYCQAYPLIDIEEKTMTELEELKRDFAFLKEKARRLGADPIVLLRQKRKTRSPIDEKCNVLREEIGRLEGLTLRRVKRKETEPNGGNCNSHAIITEEQLLSYLDDGWEIVKELSNGNIVVRRVTV